jgi:hypothetical protein
VEGWGKEVLEKARVCVWRSFIETMWERGALYPAMLKVLVTS